MSATADSPSRATAPRRQVRVGFIPLTDCAPLALAVEKGYDRRHGIELVLSKEASWAAIRDKLMTGALDAAHALYGMIYGVQMGIGGPRMDMAVLMTLNQNGQGITLPRRLHDRGIHDGATLATLLRADPRRYTFAQTFPTGNHAMWLYYWLASFGVHPFRDINNVVVPPPQMAAHMALGNVDGFCAGEPWNARAVDEGVGFTVATSQDIWPDHPGKVLACSRDCASKDPDTARALVMAVVEAARDLDQPAVREEAAAILARPEYVDVPASLILDRLQGRYRDGVGREWREPHGMRFFADGQVSYPWLSDGMWFLTQHKRWGLLAEHPDYLEVARQVNQTGIYREAASAVGAPLPDVELRASTLMDGKVWDGRNPLAYAESFKIAGGC